MCGKALIVENNSVNYNGQEITIDELAEKYNLYIINNNRSVKDNNLYDKLEDISIYLIIFTILSLVVIFIVMIKKKNKPENRL